MSTQFLVKVLVSALLVAAVSEVARRSSLLGALLASLPVTSLLAFVWLYRETGDVQKVAALSADILWLVLPSLLLFALLPLLLRQGWNFWLSLATSCAATAVAYGATTWVLRLVRG
jgi:F0F1-type ATP synthase assembly protein I